MVQGAFVGAGSKRNRVLTALMAVQMRALFALKDACALPPDGKTGVGSILTVADVFTTWSGGVPIDEFIEISEIGFSKGVKIAVSSQFPLCRRTAP